MPAQPPSQSPSLAKLIGFSPFARNTPSTDSNSKKKPGGSEDEWYIPYNGPYEAPRQPQRKEKARDSWGDPLDEYEYDEDDTVLADRELHLRYGGHANNESPRRNNGGGGAADPANPVFDDERKGRSRDRTFSGISGRTMSSGAVDPSRSSFVGQRRSTVSSGNPPPIPSYINLDVVGGAGGGVGESPVPHFRASKDGNRISLASIFSFAGGTRGPASQERTRKPLKLPKFAPSGDRDRPFKTHSRTSSSSESPPHPQRTAGGGGVIVDNKPHHHQYANDRFSSTTTDDEDYYTHQHDDSKRYNQTSHRVVPPSDVVEPHHYHQRPQYQHQYGAPHQYTQVYPATTEYTATTIPMPMPITIPDPPLGAPPAPPPHLHPLNHHHFPSSQPQYTHHRQLPKLAYPDYTIQQPTHTPTSPRPPNSADAIHSGGITPQFGGRLGAIRSLKSPSSTPNLRGGAPVNYASTSTSGYMQAGPSSQIQHRNGTAKGIVKSYTLPTIDASGPNSSSHSQHGGIISTPHHILPITTTNPPPPPTFVFPKGKDKWLSAETWCDALLLPRPRLKIKRDVSSSSSPSTPTSLSLQPEPGFANLIAAPIPTLGAGPGLNSTSTSPHHPQLATSSGRIVSPPGSPLGPEFDFGPALGADPATWSQEYHLWKKKRKEEGGVAVTSRVLAYSRSLVDLRASAREGSAVGEPQRRVENVQTNGDVGSGSGGGGGGGGRERPRSFARDDLALPTPVPSLAHVLEEGQLLSEQRKAWQRQAESSFGNKSARSLSRTRSKSLTAKGKRRPGGGHVHQSSMEYLAAQACLGSQNVALSPVIVPPKLNWGGSVATSNSTSKHEHSNSNATNAGTVITTTDSSLAKSSKGGSVSGGWHSRSHSRNDSWSRNAMRVAKGAAVGICGGGARESGVEGDEDTDALMTGHHHHPHQVQIVEPLREKEKDFRGLSLDDALNGNQTRVIRLADPVHLPVDRFPPPPKANGLNSAHHNPVYISRTSPTPSSSAMSDSRVGIALGTPPPPSISGDEDQMDGESMYMPVHPYAQGGLSFSQPTGERQHHHSSKTQRGADFAGPHPSIVSTSKVPPMQNMLSRHKLPPHLALHPYATSGDEGADGGSFLGGGGWGNGNRDSYMEKNPMLAQFRSEDKAPNPSKMWAQLSPGVGVVREILPGDIQYSPYLPESSKVGEGNGQEDQGEGRGKEKDRETIMIINDTVGVGEALVNANSSTRYKEAMREHHHQQQKLQQQRKDFNFPVFKPPIERPTVLPETQKPSDPSSNHTYGSSPLEYHIEGEEQSVIIPDRSQIVSPSPAITSDTASSVHRPRSLGSPNDLEEFKDLFYRPSPPLELRPLSHVLEEHEYEEEDEASIRQRMIEEESSIPATPTTSTSPPRTTAPSTVPWELSVGSRRTGSGLTTLARQLSEELESMAIERERASQYTNSLASTFGGANVGRTDGSLQFVFDDVPRSLSPGGANGDHHHDEEGEADEERRASGLLGDNDATIRAFKPSGAIPEDVQSSRASSMMVREEDDEDDETAMIRMARVEPISTPPILSPSHEQTSYMGETAYVHAGSNVDLSSPEDRSRILSGLHPPTDATRSSYMTTSTLSRMSGLSDFPTPPKNHPYQPASPTTSTGETATIISPPAPKHMSLLSSYFNEVLAQNEAGAHPVPPLPPTVDLRLPKSSLEEDQVVFGDNQTAADLVKTLSSQTSS